MLGFALLGLLGVGLIFNLMDDNDDDDRTAVEDESTRIQGTEGQDLIDAGPGNDTVFAAGGDDLVDAGTGNDRVFGGTDDDLILGGAGNDFLRGEAGDDLLLGGAGADVLNGDVGDDVLVGADIVNSDALIGAAFAAAQGGGDISDEDLSSFLNLRGDAMEADTLNGGVGDDLIIAGSNDVVDTGSGFDVLNVGEWVNPDAPVNVTGFPLPTTWSYTPIPATWRPVCPSAKTTTGPPRWKPTAISSRISRAWNSSTCGHSPKSCWNGWPDRGCKPSVNWRGHRRQATSFCCSTAT